MLVEALSKQSKVPIESLQWLASTASQRYKTYDIPKKTGGTRTIHHPSRSLKSIQRWIAKFLNRRVPTHTAATAYAKGTSIRKNAEAHVSTRFTLRLDFENFFPSFSAVHVTRFLTNKNQEYSLGLSGQDIEFVVNICSRYERLTIGAPSSPVLTNLIMYDFDSQVYDHCRALGQTYTRYADDMFISSNVAGALSGAFNDIEQYVGLHFSDGLKLNRSETLYLSRKYRRSITGLFITTDGKISIGRHRKREIKALVHQFGQAESTVDIYYIRGMLAFAKDCDPDFFSSLYLKYGYILMNRILASDGYELI